MLVRVATMAMLEPRRARFLRERVLAEADVRRHVEGQVTVHEPRARTVGHPGHLHGAARRQILGRDDTLGFRSQQRIGPRPTACRHAEERAM